MRHSIVTKYEDISVISGKPKETDHHLIFGKGLRSLADEDGLTIPLTHAEHNMSPNGTKNQLHDNPIAESLSKMCGQLAWEKHYIAEKRGLPFEDIEEEAREAFRKRYQKSWL